MQNRVAANALIASAILFSVLTSLTQTVFTAAADGATAQPNQTQASPCANGQESGLLLPGSFLPTRLPEIGTN